jgi:hypothetical protein
MCSWHVAQAYPSNELPSTLIPGDIFAQSTPRFNNPVTLKRIFAMIDEN